MESTVDSDIPVDHTVGSNSRPAEDRLLYLRKWHSGFGRGKSERPSLLLHHSPGDGMRFLFSRFDLIPQSYSAAAQRCEKPGNRRRLLEKAAQLLLGLSRDLRPCN